MGPPWYIRPMPIEDPALRSRLERGEIVTELTDGPGGRRDAVARALIAAPAEKIWAAITDYDRYKEFMPLTTVSRVKKREGDTVWFYTELSFPLKTIRYEIKLKLDKPRWRVNWTLVEGDLKSNEGGWQLEPYGPDGQETYVVYTAFIQAGFAVPGFIMNKITQGTLPQIIGVVRKETGDRKYR
jgi:ribosome-associated toxin RatA of RatAB toxin-antitoxin module